MPYFVSIPAFGQQFGVSRSTAYALTHDGTIRTVTIGGRRLVPVSEMERYAEQLMAEAGISEDPR